MTGKGPKGRPQNVIARWKAEDRDEDTMTASEYTYADADTRESVELSQAEAERYSWGQCQDDLTGGSQAGELRN